MNSFVSAFASVPDAPCDAYACPKKQDCAAQKLACESFIYYVNTGKRVHPLMLFRQVGQKPACRPSGMLKHTHTPTHALFSRISRTGL